VREKNQMVRRNEREGGFCKEKEEVEELEKIWRGEEDEEKKWLVIVEEKWSGENTPGD